MIYRSITFSLLLLFFIGYFYKNRQDLTRILAGVLVMSVNSISIVYGRSLFGILMKVIGEYFLISALLIIILSICSRWIKDYSRNPDVFGLFLVLIGMCLIYASIPLMIFNLGCLIVHHILVIHEEGRSNIGLKRARRYVGKGKLTYRKLKCFIYLLGTMWCILYTLTLIIYAGIRLSWLWLWPLGALFCIVRFVMIFKNIRVPKLLAMPYHIIFPIVFITFVATEIMIINAKFNVPDKNLDYIVVLGAGVNDDEPSNTLKKRIQRAADYMKANPHTKLVASGGKGPGEKISEAECIKQELIKLGIEEERIILEDRSTSTEENLLFSYRIINNPHASVGIITNSFHEFRANLIALKTGFTSVQSVPAVTLYPVGIHYTVREFFGVVQFAMKNL